MQGITIIYALFTRNLEEIKSARNEQLLVRRPDINSLHPGYMWDSMSLVEQTRWVDEEAERYDRFKRLSSLTVLAVPKGNLNPEYLNNPNNDCNVFTDDNETALLTYIWAGLEDAISRQFYICGWRIKESIWPTLINRSLALNVPMPAWAKIDLTKKWFDVQLHDLSAIYSCGLWNRTRPLPPIHYALKFWLGRDFEREENVRLLAESNPANPAIADATCAYTFGMGEVMYRYTQMR